MEIETPEITAKEISSNVIPINRELLKLVFVQVMLDEMRVHKLVTLISMFVQEGALSSEDDIADCKNILDQLREALKKCFINKNKMGVPHTNPALLFKMTGSKVALIWGILKAAIDDGVIDDVGRRAHYIETLHILAIILDGALKPKSPPPNNTVA